MNFKFLLSSIAVASLVGCASPTVTQSVKAGDTGLSCAQLQNDFQDAEALKVEAEKAKGFTGGNVVRALFFWPAILGSYSNANEAIAAADSRKVNLANIMNQKKCQVPGMTSEATPVALAK